MYKKLGMAALLLAVVLELTGCQCEHEWAEADCLNPKTCTKCGETEGEPVGHHWSEATCEAPETCTVCGLTQGESLGHIWTEANYQDPEICTTCGDTQGQPLEAGFEKHGLEINLWENKQVFVDENGQLQITLSAPEEGFPYVTTCYDDKAMKTTGALYLSNYRIVQSDETHQARDGYEWRIVDVEIEYSDSNSRKYGVVAHHCAENYYCLEDWDLSMQGLSGTTWEYLDKENSWVNCFTVSYHGEDYPVFAGCEEEKWSRWQGRTNPTDGTWEEYITYTSTFSACVPVGYDGVVVGFADSGLDSDDAYIYEKDIENALFFRLGNMDTKGE